jgi:hypothetical protein
MCAISAHYLHFSGIYCILPMSHHFVDLPKRAISGIYESSSSSRDVVFEWRLKLVSILILILISTLHCVKPS